MRSERATRERILAAGAILRVGFPPFVSGLLRRDVIAITFGRTVWLHPQLLERSPELLDPIIRHELVHVEQYRRHGMVRFMVRYLIEYLSGRMSGLTHYEAYRSISFEREAYGDTLRE